MTDKDAAIKGYVQVYTGNGKGKTTASIGMALRTINIGRRVYIAQFIKGDPSGEIEALTTNFPNAEAESFGLGRFVRGEPSAEDIEAAGKGIAKLREVLAAGEHHLVIADELNGAFKAGLVTLDDVLGLVDIRPDHVELVITGRDAHERLVEKADLVTEMRMVKHYFDDGVPSREGIEY